MNKEEINIYENSDNVRKWFSGRTLFITGATGFMGKVLLEKLLRCCPDIKRIYILCRPKKGYGANARFENLKKLPVFERLHQENPSAFKKITIVEGDILQKDLGIQQFMKERLINEVSVVINGAASLRLEAGVKSSIQNNTSSTLKIIELSCEMKQLKAFVHISTAFCHCEYDVLEEIIYPSSFNPKDIIAAVEWIDESTLDIIKPRLLGPHPNCYTFSKRLSETLVAQYASKIPVAIIRPSIVTPALMEPIPGWVDNLNGPVGIIIAAGKGLLRSMMVKEEYTAEVVPVDVAINTIILITWERGRILKEKDECVPVYNISNGDIQTLPWGEVFKQGRKIGYEHPFEAGLWYPNGTIRTNPVTHFLAIFFYQMIPAYFIDALLFLTNQKTFMVRVQKKIYIGLQMLQYFTTRQWSFVNNNAREITKKLNEEEKKIFYVDNVRADVPVYFKNCILGARQYVMKEPLSTLPKARVQQKVLYWLDWIVHIILYGTLFWFTYFGIGRLFKNYNV